METQRAKRVYVVDDEHVLAATLGMIFKYAGFESASYNDPFQLLSACEIEAPDAVVSDVMMPHMNGVDLASRLGNLYPDCKVVLMSGQAATSELLQHAREKGHVLDVLAKPVAPAALIEHVRTVLASSPAAA